MISAELPGEGGGNKFFYYMEVRSDGSMKLGGYANDTFALCLLPPLNPLSSLCSFQLLESHNTT